MTKKLGLLLSFLLGIGIATLIAQKSTDSTVVDPDVHHVVLENEHVRVFEARGAPGWKSPMHTHPPFVLVSVGSARLKLRLEQPPENRTRDKLGAVVGPEVTWGSVDAHELREHLDNAPGPNAAGHVDRE